MSFRGKRSLLSERVRDDPYGPLNKSLDASGGGVFRKIIGSAMVA